MNAKIKSIILMGITLAGCLFYQNTFPQNVLITEISSTSWSIDQMENQLSELGYTVTRLDSIPEDIQNTDVIIIMGGQYTADIPETIVDDFVHAGGGMIVFEPVVQHNLFDPAANSNPVDSCAGWEKRTNVVITDMDHPICQGIGDTLKLSGYSTSTVLKDEAHPVMVWADQTVFAAVLEYGDGRVVYINDLQAWYYGYWSGDQANGKILMENAMAWVSQKTGVDDQKEQSIANNFCLVQNYPNPFNPITHIYFELLQAGQTTLCVYNEKGNQVDRSNLGLLSQGVHKMTWNGSALSSGIYFFIIESQGMKIVSKGILLK